ncbi:subtype B tannase [Campylobacter sp.]|uniref:subtype B tannase n=1 Tax=Campylobacter sp. TaxID=205 RepID=UPI003F9FFD47
MKCIKGAILVACLAGACFGNELKFDESKFELKSVQVGGVELKFRAYEGIVYVAKPVSEYEVLNFYVPEGKFSDQRTAIFMPNAIGGYMPAMPSKPEIQNKKPNATLEALLRGYVVASVGARGRTLKDSENFIGKAPAAIVDLKAAVRYLKFNDKFMPGDANKIISNGTSAGGAMSALLGVSAGAKEYEPYLKELGAARADDQIYAASIYCPVTNLEHQDEAYEWMFGDLDKFERIDFSGLDAASFNDRSKKPQMVTGELNATQKELSRELKAKFPAYLNSLNLKDAKGHMLSLDENGEGSFKEYINALLSRAFTATKSSDKNTLTPKFITLDTQGCQLGYTFEFEDFIASLKRAKAPVAFDGLTLENPENDLFGDSKTPTKHFTKFAKEQSGGEMAEAGVIKMMNAMNYTANKKAAKFYRIRQGTSDTDLALAVPAMLALSLKNVGKEVDFEAVWGQGHGGDYDLDELFAWIKRVVER